MSSIIEKKWVTKAGLPAMVKIVGSAGHYHRCGYVGVRVGHPFYGLAHNAPTKLIKPEWILNQEIGKRSAVTLFYVKVRALDGEEVSRTLELLVDVHGSLTYSGEMEENSKCWWFGFDCAHCDDDPFADPQATVPKGPNARSLDYVVAECERLAGQLRFWGEEAEGKLQGGADEQS